MKKGVLYVLFRNTRNANYCTYVQYKYSIFQATEVWHMTLRVKGVGGGGWVGQSIHHTDCESQQIQSEQVWKDWSVRSTLSLPAAVVHQLSSNTPPPRARSRGKMKILIELTIILLVINIDNIPFSSVRFLSSFIFRFYKIFVEFHLLLYLKN